MLVIDDDDGSIWNACVQMLLHQIIHFVYVLSLFNIHDICVYGAMFEYFLISPCTISTKEVIYVFQCLRGTLYSSSQ